MTNYEIAAYYAVAVVLALCLVASFASWWARRGKKLTLAELMRRGRKEQ